MYIGIPSWNYAGLACVYVEMEDGLLNKSVLFVFFFLLLHRQIKTTKKNHPRIYAIIKKW